MSPVAPTQGARLDIQRTEQLRAWVIRQHQHHGVQYRRIEIAAGLGSGTVRGFAIGRVTYPTDAVLDAIESLYLEHGDSPVPHLDPITGERREQLAAIRQAYNVSGLDSWNSRRQHRLTRHLRRKKVSA